MGRGRDGKRQLQPLAPLRGAAAAAAEGPINRRSEKKVQRRRPPPAADTGRSCWGSGLQDASAAQGTKQTQGAATRLSEAASFFVWSPSSLGLKGASSPFLVGPARRNRRALAALNTRHLLRKPVCGLKAPLGLSCPAGTAVLSGSLLVPKENNPLSKPLSPAAPPPPAGPARPAGRRPAAPRSRSAPRRCRAAHAGPARPQRPLPAP